jgi:hypothetical protein
MNSSLLATLYQSQPILEVTGQLLPTGGGHPMDSLTIRSDVMKKQDTVRASEKPTELQKDIEEQEEARERALDETIAETFPASDPLSSDPNPAPDDAAGEEDDTIAS